MGDSIQAVGGHSSGPVIRTWTDTPPTELVDPDGDVYWVYDATLGCPSKPFVITVVRDSCGRLMVASDGYEGLYVTYLDDDFECGGWQYLGPTTPTDLLALEALRVKEHLRYSS